MNTRDAMSMVSNYTRSITYLSYGYILVGMDRGGLYHTNYGFLDYAYPIAATAHFGN